MAQVHLYGGQLEEGQTVSVDHVVQTFNLVIRSSCGVPGQTLKDHIQKQWEVVTVNEIDRTDYVL